MAKTNTGTLVIGMSGMGKSWLEGFLIEQTGKQRIILDPKNEHIGLAEHHLVLDRAAADLVESGKITWYEISRRILATQKNVRVEVKGLDYDEQMAVADGLARAIHERGHVFYAAGEYHRYAPNGRVPKWVQILHTDARTMQIDYVVSTQRPALLDTTIVSQANRRIAFKMEDPNDLKRVRSLFRPVDGRSTEDVISNLRPRNCLWINADTSEQQLVDTNTLDRQVAHHG